MWIAVCDDVLMSVLLIAACTALTTLAVTNRITRLQSDSVFAPSTSRKGIDCAHMQDTAAARIASLIYSSTAAVALAALTLHVLTLLCPGTIGIAADSTTGGTATLQFFVAVAYWFVFLFAKHLLTRLVNWTFFLPRAITQWQCVHRLSVVCGAAAWTITALLAVCNNLSVTDTALLMLVAVAAPMFVTIWGVWKLFFGKMIGCLHFLLYLCTLELLLPLLAVVVVPFIIITS